MSQFLQYLLDAISVGGVYTLLTLGLALLFGVMRLMNFAYGELIMVGGYTMAALSDQPWPIVVIAVPVVTTLFSVLTERLAFRPLRNASPVTLMIAAFAVSTMLQNLARMTIGPIAKGVPPNKFLVTQTEVAGLRISALQIVTIVLCGAVLAGLGYLLVRTALGAELRAAAEDFEMAKLLGVKANLVIVSAFAITGALAGIAALILVWRQGAVNIEMGAQPLLIAFVGAVIGGMGSLRGAAAGGFLLGVTTTLLGAMLPQALVPFRDAFVFAAVIALLVVRPQGLIPAPGVRVS